MSAADRMRRLGERQAAGIEQYVLELPHEALSEEGRFLEAWDADHRAAVEAALNTMVKTYIVSASCDVSDA
jgi:hypothetical protein